MKETMYLLRSLQSQHNTRGAFMLDIRKGLTDTDLKLKLQLTKHVMRLDYVQVNESIVAVQGSQQ